MPRIRSMVSDDPDFHRGKLKEYIDNYKREDKAGGENLEIFITSLMNIFKDDPPHSWKFSITTYEYPVFRVINKSTERENDFLRVMSDYGLALNKKFFFEKYSKLFPRQNDFYGQGKGVRINFSKFNAKKQKEYIDCIFDIVTNHPDINFI